MGYSCQVTLTTIAIISLIAPDGRILRIAIEQTFTFCHLFAYTKGTVWIIPDGMNRLARKSTEHGEHLRTFHDAPHLVTIISLVIHRLDFCIGGSLTHEPPLAIQTSSRGFANQFCLAIAIEIIDEKLGVVRTGTDVLTQIDAPELGTIQFIAIQDHIARIAIMRIIMGITWVPFQNQFIFSIAIHIPHAAIIGSIAIALPIGSDATLWMIDGQRAI